MAKRIMKSVRRQPTKKSMGRYGKKSPMKNAGAKTRSMSKKKSPKKCKVSQVFDRKTKRCRKPKKSVPKKKKSRKSKSKRPKKSGGKKSGKSKSKRRYKKSKKN